MMRLLALLLAICLAAFPAHAAQVRVAVAANFMEPAKTLAQRFKARTGHTASLTFGPSGQIYAQIANGAPFEVFLSADRERPEKAEAEGLGVVGSRFTYAVGRLVLYSRTPGLVDRRGAVLTSGRFGKLAIADPKVAPYGVAAIETLKKLGAYDAVAPRLVQGASIAQTFQFVDTGAAELGFLAFSQVVRLRGGSMWVVPESLHAPIDQQAVLLKTGARNPAALAFVQYLRTAEAKAIIRWYGYQVP